MTHRIRTSLLAITSIFALCACGGGDPPPSGDSVEFTVPTGGGAVTVNVGDTSIELTFPASAAGRTVRLTPSTAASIGYPAEEVEAALELAPAGMTFTDAVRVRPASGEPLVAHVTTGPGPRAPELLALSADGDALELFHFSTIAVLRLSTFPAWMNGAASCATGTSRAFASPLPFYCSSADVSCCAASASANCRLGAAGLVMRFTPLSAGAAPHCGATPLDAGPAPLDGGPSDGGAMITDAGATLDAGPMMMADAGPMMMADAGPMMMADAGPVMMADAGPMMTDAGPMMMPDAGAACPGTAGPAMVRVPAGFCMDSTEVTSAQYQAFLTARAGDTSGQPAACTPNTSFTPIAPDWSAEVAMRPDHPVAWVDWCDAHAYCEWAGKRLCGRRGGGPNPIADINEAAQSQWYYGCSQAGGISYPYSGVFDLMACNTRGSDGSGNPEGTLGTIRPRQQVASMPACEGGYPGIYDLSGNVSEWTDECTGTTSFMNYCMTRGGSAGATGETAQCWWNSSSQRSYAYEYIGFRCCAD